MSELFQEISLGSYCGNTLWFLTFMITSKYVKIQSLEWDGSHKNERILSQRWVRISEQKIRPSTLVTAPFAIFFIREFVNFTEERHGAIANI